MYVRPKLTFVICKFLFLFFFAPFPYRHLSDIWVICQSVNLKQERTERAVPSLEGWWNEAFQTKSVFSLFVKGMVLLLKHMLWNYKLLFGQTTMGRIHACCRKTDYVENTCFLSLVLTRIFRILLRFYSDFTQISAQKIGYWEQATGRFRTPKVPVSIITVTAVLKWWK